MTFKQMMMEKLNENVAYKVANDSTLVREVASVVLDDLDYSDIASMLAICNSDVADEIDASDVLSDVVAGLDMDEICQAVINNCDMDEIAGRVVTMLPSSFMDNLAIQAAEEIVSELK